MATQLLSKKTVARRLDVSTRTVDRWVAIGKFPKPIILPATGEKGEKEATRWSELIVESWIELHRTNSTP